MDTFLILSLKSNDSHYTKKRIFVKQIYMIDNI